MPVPQRYRPVGIDIPTALPCGMSHISTSFYDSNTPPPRNMGQLACTIRPCNGFGGTVLSAAVTLLDPGCLPCASRCLAGCAVVLLVRPPVFQETLRYVRPGKSLQG